MPTLPMATCPLPPLPMPLLPAAMGAPTARDHGLPTARMAGDFLPSPTAMALALMPAAPLALCRADTVITDTGLIRTAPRDMARFSAPTPGGVRWVVLAWTEDLNRVPPTASAQAGPQFAA